MTENEAIKYVGTMDVFEKLRVYMDYFINMLYSKHTGEYYKKYGIDKWQPKTYEDFCDKSNVQINDVGDNWKETGFASKTWIVLQPGSIFHYVYHSQP